MCAWKVFTGIGLYYEDDDSKQCNDTHVHVYKLF